MGVRGLPVGGYHVLYHRLWKEFGGKVCFEAHSTVERKAWQDASVAEGLDGTGGIRWDRTGRAQVRLGHGEVEDAMGRDRMGRDSIWWDAMG